MKVEIIPNVICLCYQSGGLLVQVAALHLVIITLSEAVHTPIREILIAYSINVIQVASNI